MITIPNVLFDGSIIYPYSIDFTSGGSDKSQLSLTFIDRNGSYDIENRFKRDASKPVLVSIGSFLNFTGYIVAANVGYATSGGSKLNIVLHDSSIILDKNYIGLKGVYGTGFSTTAIGRSDNIILVGKQIDPCKNLPPNAIDPCAPDCGEESGGTEKFNCAEEKLLKILEVNYSFQELKDSVSRIVKFGSFPKGINTDYRANYVGTLRDVLKNWCQDLGINFYWENNSVYFYDEKVGITINDSLVDVDTVISKSKSFSIEGNLTQGNLTYFGGEGEKREYTCSLNSSKRLTLRPITLLDLLEDETDGQGKPGYSFLVRNYDPHLYRLNIAVKQLYESIVLNYYSDILRDLYVLFEKEDLDTIVKMQAFAASPTKKGIPTLGGFRPSGVYFAAQEDTADDASYRVYKTLFERMSPNEAIDFANRGGYIVSAKYNAAEHDYFLNFEKRLAEDFIGKYWIRGGVDGDSYSFNAPDGNPSYYSNGSEIQFPFLNILPADIQKSSDFIVDLVGAYDPTKEDKSHGRFLVMERTAVWVPNQSADSIKKAIDELKPYHMEVLGSEDVLGRNILKAGEVWMAVFPRPKGLNLEISGAGKTKEENNPYDAKNVGLKGEFLGAAAGYGLLSALTQSYTLKTPSSSIKIILPSQAGPYEATHYPGYRVFAIGSDFNSVITKVIPKAEYILTDVAQSTDKDVGIQVNYRDITQLLVELFQAQGGTCGYDSSKIIALLNSYNSRFSSPTNIEKETREYEIAGIPTFSFRKQDGLQSFTISVTDDGISTSVSFSNLPERNETEAITLEKFKKANSGLKKANKYFKQT